MEIAEFKPAELVHRIRAGEPGAEDELVQRYTRGVYFVINRSVSDKSAAEDVYQETFRLGLEKIRSGEVREPERLSGFICGVARNLVIEQLRKSARRESRQSSDLDRPIASHEPSALDQLLREEQSLLARQVLAALSSDRDRKVLYRFYIADDDKDEICAELGVSSLHFNQILCRARERYKQLFEEMRLGKQK
jgi:RNA polymerase sigma-70 factor, ECF subfamily